MCENSQHHALWSRVSQWRKEKKSIRKHSCLLLSCKVMGQQWTICYEKLPRIRSVELTEWKFQEYNVNFFVICFFGDVPLKFDDVISDLLCLMIQYTPKSQLFYSWLPLTACTHTWPALLKVKFCFPHTCTHQENVRNLIHANFHVSFGLKTSLKMLCILSATPWNIKWT